VKIVYCSLHRPWNRESSPAASSAKAHSKFLLLPSFDMNLHFLFNNESSTDKQLNTVMHSTTTTSCERVLNIFLRQLLGVNNNLTISNALLQGEYGNLLRLHTYYGALPIARNAGWVAQCSKIAGTLNTEKKTSYAAVKWENKMWTELYRVFACISRQQTAGASVWVQFFDAHCCHMGTVIKHHYARPG